MEQRSSVIIPSLFIQTRGEDSFKVALQLTTAASRFVVRLTGGCGYMREADAGGMYDLFTGAFAGYLGALLFGGTRMVRKDDHSVVVPGITEVAPLIGQHCPGSMVMGVIPRTQDLKVSEAGLIVHQEPDNDFLTVIHPDQQVCVVVQKSADQEVPWEAEYLECLRIMHNLREHAKFASLLISYNGGSVTEKEILATAKLGWPVLLINGSGRISDQYANDQDFLEQYPNVAVAWKDVASFREQLLCVGALSGVDPKLVEVERG